MDEVRGDAEIARSSPNSRAPGASTIDSARRRGSVAPTKDIHAIAPDESPSPHPRFPNQMKNWIFQAGPRLGLRGEVCHSGMETHENRPVRCFCGLQVLERGRLRTENARRANNCG